MKGWLSRLGPGLITGASDDDPAGIATYTQAGAKFGFAPLWLALFTTPLMIAVQESCARIALTTHKGLFALFREHLPKPLVGLFAIAFIGANVFNIAADLNMMAASMEVFVPQSRLLWLIVFAVGSLLAQIFFRYKLYANILRWLALALLAYVAVLFFADVSWGEALRATFIPRGIPGKEFVLMVVAILGTTLSPYLFVWQASDELEDQAECRREHIGNTAVCSIAAHDTLPRMRFDVSIGMIVSNVVFWCILTAAAATLHAQGIQDIATPADAARVLQPLLGSSAIVLFTIGIIGTGLLTIPVLAGSAGFVMAEWAGWRRSLNNTWQQARAFYLCIGACMFVAIILACSSVSPIRMLIASAVVNAFLAPPLLLGIFWLGNHRGIMKNQRNGVWSNVGIGLAILIMTLALAVFAWFSWT